MGLDESSPGRAAFAAHDQVVAGNFAIDAVRDQSRGSRSQAIGFLHAQLGEPAHACLAFGERCRHRKHDIFVDHRGRARSRNIGAFERRRAYPQVGNHFARVVAATYLFDPRSHLAERIDEACAQRIQQHVFKNNVRARHDERRNHRKCSRGDVRRHHDFLRHQFRPAAQRDLAAVLSVLFARNLRAEMREHPLGVIAGRFLFDDGGFAVSAKPTQEHRRLYLCGRHRRFVRNRNHLACTAQAQRQPAALRLLHHFRTHPHQRIENAAHRTFSQRGIAVKNRRERVTCDHAHRETASGAGVAKIEHLARREQRAYAKPVHAPAAFGLAHNRCTHGTNGLRRCDDVLAFEQPFDLGAADGKRPDQERAMRDRLVARHAQPARKRAAFRGRHRLRG